MFLESDPNGMPPFHGDLAAIELVDVFRILTENQASGELSVTNSHGTGEIYFQQGQIVHAVYGERSGERAISRLLAWPALGFEFFPSKRSEEKTVRASTAELLSYCDLISEEWDFIKETVPSSDTIFVRSANGSVGRLNPMERIVFRELDGVKSVREVARRLDYNELGVRRILRQLVRSDLIEAVKPGQPAPASPPSKTRSLTTKDKLMLFSFVIVTLPLLVLSGLLNHNFKLQTRRQFQQDSGEGLRIIERIFAQRQERLKLFSDAIASFIASFRLVEVFSLPSKGLPSTPYQTGTPRDLETLHRNNFYIFLEKALQGKKVDFLLITDRNGRVTFRRRGLGNIGEELSYHAFVRQALKNRYAGGVVVEPADRVWSEGLQELVREAPAIFIEAAVPVVVDNTLVGTVLAGNLAHTDVALMDEIKTAYKNYYRVADVSLHLAGGNPHPHSHVSTLHIRDVNDRIVETLYVSIQENSRQKFEAEMRNSVVITMLWVLWASLALVYIVARHLFRTAD